MTGAPASPTGLGSAKAPEPHSGLRPSGAIPRADEADDEFNRLMDATQTLIQLKVGDVLTQEMIDDLNLVDEDHRESFERATEAFHKGYQAGLERGAGADTAKLIEERDQARTDAAIFKALAKARGEQ